jgi:Enoyl-(Acyl carrier protein) reductase
VLVQGDLSIVANIRRMYDVAMKEFGRVDIVVNNAGYIKKKPLVEVTEEEFDRCAGINTKGLYFSMQEAAKRIADNGRIINIGTSLLGASTGMYSAYTGTEAPVEKRNCTTAFGGDLPHPFSLWSHLAHGKKKRLRMQPEVSLEAGLAALSAAARTTLAERANQLLFKL